MRGLIDEVRRLGRPGRRDEALSGRRLLAERVLGRRQGLLERAGELLLEAANGLVNRVVVVTPVPADHLLRMGQLLLAGRR